MEGSKNKPLRRVFDGAAAARHVASAIAAEMRSARAAHNLRFRYDTPSPARHCVACAICGTFFWHYGRPVITCSTPCSQTFKRTSMLRLNAKRRGEHYLAAQNYKIWNRQGLAPPRVALRWRTLAMARVRRRRKQRERKQLLARVHSRTITARELAYLRETDADILMTAFKAMSSIFTREQTERIRARIAGMVVKNLDRAEAYLAGATDPNPQDPNAPEPVKWGPNHVVLFGRLLNKVVPDLSQSHVHTTTEAVSPDTLTFEQLQAIALGTNTSITLAPSKVITHDPQPRSRPDPVHRDSPGPSFSDRSPEPPVDPA